MKVTLAVLALLLAAAPAASASGPSSPPAPFRIVAEPPGPNCAAGGIKVIVPHLPHDLIYIVCNGTKGPAGPTAPAGPPGRPGLQGPAGAQGPAGSSGATCVNTRRSAIMGPLPHQFKPGMLVTITTKGHTQTHRVMPGRKVLVNTSNLPCGVYPIAIRHGKLRPAWRIWSLTGGNTLNRFWFPGAPFVSTF